MVGSRLSFYDSETEAKMAFFMSQIILIICNVIFANCMSTTLRMPSGYFVGSIVHDGQSWRL